MKFLQNAAADDVAAISAAAAIVPLKKPKSTDLNNKIVSLTSNQIHLE